MSLEKSESWWLYIVQTRYGHWYTGVSNNVAKRLQAHERGKGAKNLKGKGPLTLVFTMPVGTRSEACKLEIEVKKRSRAGKEKFVNEHENHRTQVLAAPQ
ncbi:MULTISPECIES: GIY-YIG nuclease family protein [unclassified Pseudoalteromonas]|uniref:GIY-YIG nuclease family protein n=1 Tax=unclassified Pseudoalteromonas TaxID=194690 RepID=UPI000CF724F9|nr:MULTISPECIES: GIY-YIG nuclease family protein [unclassified Pseudoalteromonas]MBS3796286.1 GIY-YIG nuclease family protein [Pseudoalteromonas sp. BDTF-M6]